MGWAACLHKEYSIRKQLLTSFLTVTVAILIVLVLAVALLTEFFVGGKAKSEARESVRKQIERHLKSASLESAATLGEGFRRMQHGLLDMTSFAFRDAMLENLRLRDGTEGYPLRPRHTDLRDTEISSSSEANLESGVDLSRSVWYYANETSYNEAEIGEEDKLTVAKSARLDLLWPAAYNNSNDVKGVYVAVKLSSTTSIPVFRYFPGRPLSGEPDMEFPCDAADSCYDASGRTWYTDAEDQDCSEETNLGSPIVTEPYVDGVGSEGNWVVTLARAVYQDCDSTMLGVVGVDVRLEQVQSSIERTRFLVTGYSILATAEGKVVAAPPRILELIDATTTVCDAANGICSGIEADDLLEAINESENKVYSFTSLDGSESIVVAAPVSASFNLETRVGGTPPTHYILSIAPKSEIFEPVEIMADHIRDSVRQLLGISGLVAVAAIIAVTITVCLLSKSITRPIDKMTEAAKSIARDGANTNIFGRAAREWRTGTTAGSTGVRADCLDSLCCRGDDEIKTLEREFGLMITGLGRRRSGTGAPGLSSKYPLNPFTSPLNDEAPIRSVSVHRPVAPAI